jgi:hypothetical protein
MNLYVCTSDIYFFWRKKKKLNNRASGSNIDGFNSILGCIRPTCIVHARERNKGTGLSGFEKMEPPSDLIIKFL